MAEAIAAADLAANEVVFDGDENDDDIADAEVDAAIDPANIAKVTSCMPPAEVRVDVCRTRGFMCVVAGDLVR